MYEKAAKDYIASRWSSSRSSSVHASYVANYRATRVNMLAPQLPVSWMDWESELVGPAMLLSLFDDHELGKRLRRFMTTETILHSALRQQRMEERRIEEWVATQMNGKTQEKFGKQIKGNSTKYR